MMGNYTYESPIKPESKDWAKDKVKELFGDDLTNLQSTVATTAINVIIKKLDDRTTTVRQEHESKGAGLVIAVQMILKEYGYYDGKLDGLIGNKTRQALVHFEKNNNLTVDKGIIGPQVLRKLVDGTAIVISPVGSTDTSPKSKIIKEGSKKYEIVNGSVTIDGVMYPEVFEDKIPDGLGFCATPYVAYGMFKNGELNGQGTIVVDDLTYSGEFKDGYLRHGTGINKHGLIFSGDWTDREYLLIIGDKKINISIAFLENVDKNDHEAYVKYRTELRDGDGSKVNPINKAIYTGTFKNGELNGQGTIIFSNKTKKEGRFESGGLKEGSYTNEQGVKIGGDWDFNTLKSTENFDLSKSNLFLRFEYLRDIKSQQDFDKLSKEISNSLVSIKSQQDFDKFISKVLVSLGYAEYK